MNENEQAVPMSCAQFEAALDDLDRDLDEAGARGMEVRELALAHAEWCSGCAQLMNDVEALDFSLQRIAVQDVALQAPARVEAALLQELRARKAAGARKKEQWRMALAGIAAMALLTTGVSLRHVLVKDAAHSGTVSGTAGLSASNAESEQGTSVEASDATEVADNVADSGDSTAFIALPYATDPGTLDGGTVVRVELSRAALASMGMPVTDAGSFERIPADIMLSEDGVPQAIRLVSTESFGQ